MKHLVATSFFDGLHRLDPKSVGAAVDAAEKYVQNPAQPGLSLERVGGTFWSMRASRDLRIILHRDGDTNVLLWVDHHDPAYAWANRRRVATHPATGAAQLIVIPEQEVDRADTPPQPGPPTKHRGSPAQTDGRPPARGSECTGLLAHIAADQLLAMGVPPQWVGILRTCDSDDGIEDLLSQLPSSAAKRLLDVLAGGAEPGTHATPKDVPPYDHPDARQTFHELTGPESVHHLARDSWPAARKARQRIEIGRDKLGHAPSIRVPERQGTSADNRRDRAARLDQAQQRYARKIARGHQVIKGPAGSGKTMLLAHRCRYLHLYDPKVKRILVVCFNIAFGSYLDRLLRDQGVGAGQSRVETHHFFRLCARILGEHVRYQGESGSYYSDLVKRALCAVQEGRSKIPPFDAVLVDEGQDFDDDMLRTLTGLLNEGGDFLIVLDPQQDLYRRRSSWASLGIRATGNTRELPLCHRSTYEITQFCRALVDGPQTKQKALTLPLLGDDERHGDPPLLVRQPDLGAVTTWLVQDIHAQLGSGGYPRSQVAVIYDDKKYGQGLGSAHFDYGEKAMPRSIVQVLEDSGIPSRWVSEDVRSKELFDITTDRVTVVSVHSAKGLEFDLVYLVGLDRPDDAGIESAQRAAVAYVGASRARDRLVIPFVHSCGLTDVMSGIVATITNPT